MIRKDLFLAVFILFWGIFTLVRAETVTIDFENAKDVLNVTWSGDDTNGYYYNGSVFSENVTTGSTIDTSITIDGVTLNNQTSVSFWNGDRYDSWGGWAVSQVKKVDNLPTDSNLNNSDFWNEAGNQFAAYPTLDATTGSGATSGSNGSESYLIAYDTAATGYGITPTITFNETVSLESLSITNTGYTAYSAMYGDSFANEITTTDSRYWYRVSIVGRDALGEITGIREYMLIDNELEQPIITDWEELDFSNPDETWLYLDDAGSYLSSYGFGSDYDSYMEAQNLGDNTESYEYSDLYDFIKLVIGGEVQNSFENINSLEFCVSGTEGNEYGLTLASYFALDNLVYSIVSVPEPSAFWLLLAGGLAVFYFRGGKAGRKHSC